MQVPAQCLLHMRVTGFWVLLNIALTHFIIALAPQFHHVRLQIACCDQLLAFLSRYAPAAQEATTSAVSQSVEAPEGMKVVKKKGTEEELDKMFTGLGAGKGGKSKGKKGRAGPGSSDGAKPKDTKLNFSPEIYQGFSKVKVRDVAVLVAAVMHGQESGPSLAGCPRAESHGLLRWCSSSKITSSPLDAHAFRYLRSDPCMAYGGAWSQEAGCCTRLASAHSAA